MTMFSFQRVFKMECNLCDQMFPLKQLFKCRHENCTNNEKIYCIDCGKFYHRKKSHSLLTRADKEDINLEKKQQKQEQLEPNEEEEKKPTNV